MDALRAEALGQDSRNGRYWYFGTSAGEDCWLYRSQGEAAPAAEGRPPAPAASEAPGTWSAVCSSLQELQALAAELAASSGEPERRLAAVRMRSRPAGTRSPAAPPRRLKVACMLHHTSVTAFPLDDAFFPADDEF